MDFFLGVGEILSQILYSRASNFISIDWNLQGKP